jgi:predicted RNA-binding protein Jag
MAQQSPPYVREGALDRPAVLRSLQQWLDGVLPKTSLNLRYRILAETVSGAAPGNSVPASGTASAAAPASADGFEKPEVVVVFEGADQSVLLERGAEVLLALEYLAVRSLRLDPPFFDRIRFDCGDYRAMRITELMMSARVAADRVRETKQPFRLNPMAARERRIVHLALKDMPGIRTSSEGIGEERQVVILPATAK